MINPFYTSVLRFIDERKALIEERLCQGTFTDFAAYQRMVGQYEGVLSIEIAIRETYKKVMND